MEPFFRNSWEVLLWLGSFLYCLIEWKPICNILVATDFSTFRPEEFRTWSQNQSEKSKMTRAFMVFETGKKNLWKPKTQNFQAFKKGYKFLFKQKIGSKSSHWKWQIFLQRSSSLKSEPSIVTIIEWVQFICPTAFQYGSHDFVAAVAPQSSE